MTVELTTGLLLLPVAGVTAGRGTMKRKEQLREVYNKHNKGVEDDIFDATPLKTGIQKKVKRALINDFLSCKNHNEFRRPSIHLMRGKK